MTTTVLEHESSYFYLFCCLFPAFETIITLRHQLGIVALFLQIGNMLVEQGQPIQQGPKKNKSDYLKADSIDTKKKLKKK
jgi:hypothetical protein